MLSSEDKKDLESPVSFLRTELSRLRTGRASPEFLDNVKVDAYGSMMPLKHVASISVSDPHTIVVQVWDNSLKEAVNKAIQSANLGVNPVIDGNIIRVSIPTLTQEVREDYVKQMKAHVEETKVSIRQVRHKLMEEIEKLVKDGLSEDDAKRDKDEIEKAVVDVMKDVDEIAEKKETELRTV